MEKQPFFTIGIPVYNTEKWIGECIESVLGQNFTSFELICVDDGSKDKSLEIMCSYAEKDSRIKVISRANGGPSTARNSILYNARGEYILFLDSDDKMNTDILNTAFKALKDADYPDIMEAGFINVTNGIESEYKPVYPGDEYFSDSLTRDERAVKLCVDKKYVPFVPAKFIKTSFLTQNGIVFNPRYMLGEDADFIFQIHRKANTIKYIDILTSLHYSPREGSIVSNPSEKSIHTMLSFETELYRDSKYWNLRPEFRKMLWDRLLVVATEKRNYTLEILSGNVKKSDVLSMTEMIEGFIGPYLKYMPKAKGTNGIIFALYRLIGMKRTVSLLYNYLKAKGVITNE